MTRLATTLALMINACALPVLAAAVAERGSSDCMARDRGAGLSDSGTPAAGMMEVKP